MLNSLATQIDHGFEETSSRFHCLPVAEFAKNSDPLRPSFGRFCIFRYCFPRSSDHILHYIAVHIGEPEVAAGVAIGHAFVINA